MISVRTTTWTLGISLGLSLIAPKAAEACGCFAPPTPAEPVVQAGERIVFTHADGKVTAYVQIQYEGSAKEFAWLVPVPEVPEVRVGSEELFTALEANTGPVFLLNQQPVFCADSSSLGCGESASAVPTSAPESEPPPSPPVAVVQSSAGPYDFAVVRADAKEPMLTWLQDNQFFVPATTEAAIDPYIRPGSYFLALRLRAGQSAGDIQPVVLEYEADRPMIPIILTSIAANPDMGILVWVLGQHRAVPRNYRHIELNEEYIDWVNGASNYSEVVARAVDEAEGGHAFITEYAGTTDIMVGVLDPDGRFGAREEFETAPDLEAYEFLLRNYDFDWDTLIPIFKTVFPMPSAAAAAGITEDEYYENLASAVAAWHPAATFNAIELTDQIWTRVVEPTREAGLLFRRFPKMTRLYTALSPEEMTEDPVFDENPDLPDVSNEHSATLVTGCDTEPELILSDGRSYPLDLAGREGAPRTTMIQVLGMEGEPMVEIDHRDTLLELSRAATEGAGGCRSHGRSRGDLETLIIMFGIVFLGRVFMKR